MSRTQVLLVVLFLTANCASSQIPPVGPPPEPEPIHRLDVGRDLDPAIWLCVEHDFGDGPLLARFDCITIGELRSWVRHIQRADNN